MLVPEIALTPQTVARFQARFGDTVALLHSALSEGERYDEWRRLRTSEARIAVGPRSAVFAPVEQPRPDRPRRGARRLLQAGRRPALRRPPRRRLPRLPVGRAAVAGSATPRPETVHAMHRLRLPSRVETKKPLVFQDDPAPPGVHVGRRRTAHHARRPPRADGLPPVRILDMRESQHSLHPETRRAILGTRKSIVLLNRRGWSNFLSLQDVREGVGVPALRRRAGPAPRAARDRLPPLRPQGTASRNAATRAAPSPSPATAPAPNGSSTSCAASSTSRSSAWTPTPRRPRTPSPSCSRASTRRRPASCSAPRWWPRATTSRT